MPDYPQAIVEANHIEPVPRRIRAYLGEVLALDTMAARYVWEWPYYPQYYIPLADIDPAVLEDENHSGRLRRGTARRFGVRSGDVHRPGSAQLYAGDVIAELANTVHFQWDAFDRWFEEDEEVFVHPRNPYTRVDALRSTRTVRVEYEGAVLAESNATVMVFETGLPTRYYFNKTDVDFARLVATETVTACPYKGRTTGYWAVQTGDELVPDLAWCYDFPTAALIPIAGLVSFYNEKLDIFIGGTEVPRPHTHFS